MSRCIKMLKKYISMFQCIWSNTFSADFHLCKVLIVETDRAAHLTTTQVFSIVIIIGWIILIIRLLHSSSSSLSSPSSPSSSCTKIAMQACAIESAAHHHGNHTVCLAILVRIYISKSMSSKYQKDDQNIWKISDGQPRVSLAGGQAQAEKHWQYQSEFTIIIIVVIVIIIIAMMMMIIRWFLWACLSLPPFWWKLLRLKSGGLLVSWWLSWWWWWWWWQWWSWWWWWW